MVTFPVYAGPPLPKLLNPLNFRHYALLLGWIYFQPSRLKYYLYQADPQLYSASEFAALARSLRTPSYRNVWLMGLLLSIVIPILLQLSLSAVLGFTPDWSRILRNVALGVALGVTFGVAFGMAVGVAVGVVSGLAVGVVFGVAGGVAVGVAGGVAVGVAVGMAFGVVFGVVFGVAGGVVFGVAGGVAVGAAVDVAVGVAVGAGLFIGSLRLPFYLLQLLLFALPKRFTTRLPVVWDELMVLPNIGLQHRLKTSLMADFQVGLSQCAAVMGNPFQRWAAQSALSAFLCQHISPLTVIYTIAHSPVLNQAQYLPDIERRLRRLPSQRKVLLRELGQAFVNRQQDTGKYSELLVWRVTNPMRWRQPVAWVRFCRVLSYVATVDSLEILEASNVKDRPGWHSIQAEFPHIFAELSPLLHGDEVAHIWRCAFNFKEFDTIAQLASASDALYWVGLLASPYLLPKVIDVLRAFDDLSRIVQAYLQTSSNSQKSLLLNRSAGDLNELEKYIRQQILLPERSLLLAVVGRWQKIIDEVQGDLGEQVLRAMTPLERLSTTRMTPHAGLWQRPNQPIANPYVTGDPVVPPLFVGRNDIFTRIAHLWSNRTSPDSIILYGHRRMGKSSILRNLHLSGYSNLFVVYVDLQGSASLVESTADLIFDLADRLHSAFQRYDASFNVTAPRNEDYDSPTHAKINFERLLRVIEKNLNGKLLVLALDEFEAIELAVHRNAIGKDIYDYLRSIKQQPWMSLILAGKHTLDEMSLDYQQSFYGSYTNILVSYLSQADCERLITNPTPEFAINYTPEAVQHIIDQTGGQPLLVQLVCRDALDQLNTELFDQNKRRAVKIGFEDVDFVLRNGFFERGTNYFAGVWSQTYSRLEAQAWLSALAQQADPWSVQALQTAGLYDQALLEWSQRRDILRTNADGAWLFCVPLMRRYINERPQSRNE